jgi:glutamyl-tRNA reductase
MIKNSHSTSEKFFVAGINYKKSDVNIRGQFAISADEYKAILANAPQYHLSELFILSTCNRTEIYGVAENPSQLIDLLCSETPGSSEDFTRLAYIKKGEAAIEHLFHVGAGLDSQLLGDYEIVGQIRQAVKIAKDHNFIHTFLDKLVNAVLQASKVIRTATKLSEGTVSVSFSAIQYIKENISNIPNKKILLVGIGKIGHTTCRNMVDYLGTTNITLINRSRETAAALANELHVCHAPMNELAASVHSSDIILVATSASDPVLLKSHFKNKENKLIIDLSVPCNVEAGVEQLPGITFINVDDLSKVKDDTFQKREMEIPKVKSILRQHMNQLMEWYEARKHVPVLKAVKSKLNEINSYPGFVLIKRKPVFPMATPEEKIQRILNVMASKMRQKNQHGCYYIEAINEYIGIIN